ncbi:MAG TPA: TA system VapC family ribonuclease toxin [Opitutales bacterium]|nr:TA system VapC family ribonuclease toxin [Opitutales bacterium]
MSYSIDANILIYAANTGAPEHATALRFMQDRATETEMLCMTWPALMAFQRISTHPAIFGHPLSPEQAWSNVASLLALPRCRCLSETTDFAGDYARITKSLNIRGNLVPDAHIATILHQHGVERIYTVDSDFRKFDFLDVINPLA